MADRRTSRVLQPATSGIGSHHTLRIAGYTLIELLVTMSVAAIVAAVAIPSFRSFLQNDRQWTQATNLVVSLNAARSEAIKQDVTGGVSVCASSDGATCNANAWSQGWIVISNAPNSTPIQSMPALSTGTTLSEASALLQVTYFSNGTVSASAAFTMCDQRGASSARYTQVTTAGRVTSSAGKKPNGTPLICP
jgi:type IV fimbrial biogenesis protein FimT